MHYHFFISSPPSSEKSTEALMFAEKILAQGHEIKQAFFYDRGVLHAADLALAQEWANLVQQPGKLKVCQAYSEKYQVSSINAQFVLTGLIDFFAIHWQDQGVLVQF